jgi:hypothetical protein
MKFGPVGRRPEFATLPLREIAVPCGPVGPVSPCGPVSPRGPVTVESAPVGPVGPINAPASIQPSSSV